MIVSSIYRRLFEVTCYHNYFLDDGELSFDSMSDAEKEKSLRKYNWENYMKFIPSIPTQRILEGQKIRVKHHPAGIIFMVKVDDQDERIPFISLSENLDLVFKISFSDPYFENYTQLNLSPDKLLYFSNKTPVLPDPFSFDPLPRFDQNKNISDDYFLAGDNKREILENLDFSDNQSIHGIIRIVMKGDDAAVSVIQNNGKIKNPPAHFKIHFDNQKTIWKYIDKKTGFEVETQQPKPLTQNGFIQLTPPSDFKSPPPQIAEYQFPNPDAKKVKFIANEYYSEILI